jgi:hypothetical protein
MNNPLRHCTLPLNICYGSFIVHFIKRNPSITWLHVGKITCQKQCMLEILISNWKSYYHNGFRQKKQALHMMMFFLRWRFLYFFANYSPSYIMWPNYSGNCFSLLKPLGWKPPVRRPFFLKFNEKNNFKYISTMEIFSYISTMESFSWIYIKKKIDQYCFFQFFSIQVFKCNAFVSWPPCCAQ